MMRKTFANIKRGDTIYFIDRYEKLKDKDAKEFEIHKTVVNYIHEGKKHNTIMIHGHKYGFKVDKAELFKNMLCFISLYDRIVLSPSLWKIKQARKQLIDWDKENKNNNR